MRVHPTLPYRSLAHRCYQFLELPHHIDFSTLIVIKKSYLSSKLRMPKDTLLASSLPAIAAISSVIDVA